ncbi:MAG: hypothetical protein P8077_05290 [Gammaproteobacteria bacterium]
MGENPESSIPPTPRAHAGPDCHRYSRTTAYLDHFKPGTEETTANQTQILRFQVRQNLEMHRTAMRVIGLLDLSSPSPTEVPQAENLTALAQTLSDYRGHVRDEAHLEFGGALLNALAPKINAPRTPELRTLKGRATQSVIRALRNTMIDEGISNIQTALKKHGNDLAATQALFRLATAVEFLDVSRFNPLLAYHDIDHTLWVVQGSMAIVAGTYDRALAYATGQINTPSSACMKFRVRGEAPTQKVQQEKVQQEIVDRLQQKRPWELHKTMLFSAAHDSFFEFESNSIVRHHGRRDASSSEGLSAQNLKGLLTILSDKLGHAGVSERIASIEFQSELLEAIFATVPEFKRGTVTNGTLSIAESLTEIPDQFLCRMATALADLEETLLPDPQRFIAKSLLLNQEGSPSVDMSLIEHRSGVILTLSNHDEQSLNSTVANKADSPGFAEALYSWQRWMSSQPNFAAGRQRETAILIETLIHQRDALQHQADSSAESTQHTDILCTMLLLDGLIDTLLERYAKPESEEPDTGEPNESEVGSYAIIWRDVVHVINNQGERAARRVVQELSDCLVQSLDRPGQLVALARTLKKNLPASASRLTIPQEDSVKHLEDTDKGSRT